MKNFWTDQLLNRRMKLVLCYCWQHQRKDSNLVAQSALVEAPECLRMKWSTFIRQCRELERLGYLRVSVFNEVEVICE